LEYNNVMINTKIYSQRDWRWALVKFGFGGGRFKDYGCTVTALTGLLFTVGYDLTPPQVAEKLRKVNGFSGDLLIWSKVEKAFPKVKFQWRFYKYNNTQVKQLISKGVPVMVEVLLSGHRHWVLFLGDQKMSDPWTGKVLSTSTYTPIGYAVFSL
jgi:hypothetical protein